MDLAKPPRAHLTPFHVYVALSRSTGRVTIRILRDFDWSRFTTHPSADLAVAVMCGSGQLTDLTPGQWVRSGQVNKILRKTGGQ